MKKINFCILLTLFVFCTNLYVSAQVDKRVRTSIEFALISYYNTRGAEVFSKPQYKNKAYIIGFAIRINSVGKVDSVMFTNQTSSLDSIVSFNSIRKEIFNHRYKFTAEAFSNYRNTVFVGLALVRKDWEHSIENLAEFDKNFYNAVPNIEQLSKGKNVIFLPTFSMVQMRGSHN